VAPLSCHALTTLFTLAQTPRLMERKIGPLVMAAAASHSFSALTSRELGAVASSPDLLANAIHHPPRV
jgi:hypothetical protein